MLAGRMQGAFFKLELNNVMSSYFIDKSFIENIQINQKKIMQLINEHTLHIHMI